MRIILIFLAVIFGLLQIPLWIGKGGWLDAVELEDRVTKVLEKNNVLNARNDKLKIEVNDLRDGTAGIEERARYELGMIKDGEVYIQLPEAPVAASSAKGEARSQPDSVHAGGSQ